MTTLKNLKGTAIQFLDADPVVYAGSWSSGGSVNTARQYGAGIGSSTAGLIFGGSSPPVVANTEQYNGTAWTEVNDLNAAQNAQGSAGTLTSGMSALGAQSPGANVEDWNGSTWSANPHSLNSARQFPGGDGASNDSAIMVGGEPAPNGALTEIYNGSSWTESVDLNTARNQLAAAGTVTALIAMGGNTGADAETFNGSSWTAVTDMNSGRGGLSGSGTSTLALAFAGNPDVASTESWNGSAWTEVNDLSTGREFGASSNITGNTTAFLASGNTTTLVSNTEEWSFPPVTATILQEGDMWFNSSSSTLKGYSGTGGIPSGTWASGGNMNTPRSNHFALGTQTANIVTSPQGVVTTESYNGSSWTALPSPANSGEGRAEGGSAGTQTAGVIFGGWEPGASALTETWNGSIWTEVSDLNTGRSEMAGLGTQTAAFSCGGGPNVAIVESWDGSSWTETTDLNTGRGNFGGAGTTTDGLVFGGTTSNASTESWNGSAWTEVSDLNTGRNYGAVAGVSAPLTMYAGGNPATGITEAWNGSSWTEVADMASARYSTKGAPGSTGASMLVSGGTPGPNATLTEEYTSTAAVVTVTTS